jgi:hypothetical protein
MILVDRNHEEKISKINLYITNFQTFQEFSDIREPIIIKY